MGTFNDIIRGDFSDLDVVGSVLGTGRTSLGGIGTLLGGSGTLFGTPGVGVLGSLVSGSAGIGGIGRGGANISGMAGSDEAFQRAIREAQLQQIQNMGQNTGMNPEYRKQQEATALQGIRGGQSARGMFRSGLGTKQESNLMTGVRGNLDAQDWQRQLGLSGVMGTAINPQYSLQQQAMQNAANQQIAQQQGKSQLIGGGMSMLPAVLAASDENLKEDIHPLGEALDRVMKIRGISFKWKDEAKSFGVLAQEVQKVFPEFVQKHPSGYLAVNYMALTAHLLEAIKELAVKVNKLEGVSA